MAWDQASRFTSRSSRRLCRCVQDRTERAEGLLRETRWSNGRRGAAGDWVHAHAMLIEEWAIASEDGAGRALLLIARDRLACFHPRRDHRTEFIDGDHPVVVGIALAHDKLDVIVRHAAYRTSATMAQEVRLAGGVRLSRAVAWSSITPPSQASRRRVNGQAARTCSLPVSLFA